MGLAMDCGNVGKLRSAIVFFFIGFAYALTDPNDAKVLNDFVKGLENPELLKWPPGGNDPCGPRSYPHVICSEGRVTQIQVAKLGLKGTLPQSFNQLTKLQNLGLQKNQFTGKLPTFSGLSDLQFVYLDNNEFDTIPSDFFHGLTSVRVLALGDNPFNVSTGGWSIPNELQDSVQLTNFSCSNCNIVGPLPDFLGKLPSLTMLSLAYNRLNGAIPPSFSDSMLQILWLNDQSGGGMTGTIDVIASMVSLSQVWLHGNHFTGTIPENIRSLTSLTDLNLNGNRLVGRVPLSLANMNLAKLDLNNNMLMGPIPKFKGSKVTYASNSFCQPNPGQQCAPEVNALLDFLGDVNYPSNLASSWTGNDPCSGPWLGVSCNQGGEVSMLNLQRLKLNGTLSPSLANLGSLMEIHLGGNNLSGIVPSNLTQLNSLRLLDLHANNFSPPLPTFRVGVKVITNDNPLLAPNQPMRPLPKISSPVTPSPGIPSPNLSLSPNGSPHGGAQTPPGTDLPDNTSGNSKGNSISNMQVGIIAAVVAVCILIALVILLCCCKKKTKALKAQDSVARHPKDNSYPHNSGKISAFDNSFQSGKSYESKTSSGDFYHPHKLESGNLVISVQILRSVTDNFSLKNELGRGGFGAVYKGELEDGTIIAVKRMESGVISNKALDEFQAEIAVLSNVRHRHLVSLLGYTVEGNENLLVYEYMSQGALSSHLFYWKSLNLPPLSWAQRLYIALDVARGMDYLHNLAHQSFIHRDLKSSNILLDDGFRAKVSDFGLVKLAPGGEKSIATKLAGTFGYLAPEYAVTGKITTKADVFSYGVVLMELVTGLMALDDRRSEESRYLAEWFSRLKSNKEKLFAVIDPTIDAKEEIFDSVCIVAELAGHCTARDPNHRPDMGHAVNVLSALIEEWKPMDEEVDESSDIDYTQPLPQMLRGWQEEAEFKDLSYSSIPESNGSIPTRPAGFADSFSDSDAR